MENKSDPLEAAARAVAVLGGPSSTARRLGVGSRQTVEAWLKSGVPVKYCPDVESATREAGRVVFCEELRPEVKWSVVAMRHATEAIAAGASLETPVALRALRGA